MSALVQISSAAVLPVTVAVLLGAQGSPATGSQRAEPNPTQAAKGVTTIVGCLVQGDPSGNEQSQAGTSNATEFFVRTPAIAVPVGTTLAVGGSGNASAGARGQTTTSAGAPTSTTVYRITGLDRSQLQPHVGHRVELQGSLSANIGSPASAAPAGRATAGERRDLAGVLNASAIKMVSASCP